MDSRYVFLLCFAASTFASVSARAVNISNTWMLPEEGFPVFYRYFRDRISWYEADAVCQFHHANLVTVDSTSQYDAIRAYLKELDITNNVWIGLSKSPDKPNFSWRDFRPLSTESYWQEAIPNGNDPLCAAMDPAADFRWHALPCGGPEVASFICELPVPSWASGPGGCLLTELPSLTVLYIPEQSALELTSDCGLDGTKRIACKGNADRDEMMRQLACSITRDDFDDNKSTKTQTASSVLQDTTSASSAAAASSASASVSTDPPPNNAPNIKTTKPWIWTSNTIDTGDDYGSPTRHRRETVDTMSPPSTKSTQDISNKDKMKKKQSSPPPPTTFKHQILSQVATAPSRQSQPPPTASTPRDALSRLPARPDDKFAAKTTIPLVELTTQDPSRPEEQAETFVTATATAESKSPELPAAAETGEFPAAISQGQLFSIIENGTMFDIIELNETGTTGVEENKMDKDKTTSGISATTSPITKPTGTVENTKITGNDFKPATTNSVKIELGTQSQVTSTSPTEGVVFTTVLYQKEPPGSGASSTLVTNTSPGASSSSKKDLHNFRTSNDLYGKEVDKTLSKEVEMLPVVPGSSYIKLNRTNRKELPMVYDPDLSLSADVNLDVDNHLSPTQEPPQGHHVVEIKLHDLHNRNLTQTTFVVTTKRNGKDNTQHERQIETSATKEETLPPTKPIQTSPSPTHQETPIEIDPKIHELNNKNLQHNKDSEMVTIPTRPINPIERFDEVSSEEIMRHQFLPKPLLGTNQKMQKQDGSTKGSQEEPMEPEPEAQPRPNRQRQLTRTQRRSFYPYFFSRVLG